ncbi:hypothetical protein ACXIVK_27875 [Paraburkholderia caledonica]|jgi:hypothetical protein
MKLPVPVADFYRTHARPALDASGQYLYDLTMPDGAQLRIFTAQAAIQLNDDLDVEEQLPGFFAVGNDAGDDILCVKIDTGEVVQVPMSPMDAIEALHVADSLSQIVADGVE